MNELIKANSTVTLKLWVHKENVEEIEGITAEVLCSLLQTW